MDLSLWDFLYLKIEKKLVIKINLKASSFRKNGFKLVDLILVEPGDATR